MGAESPCLCVGITAVPHPRSATGPLVGTLGAPTTSFRPPVKKSRFWYVLCDAPLPGQPTNNHAYRSDPNRRFTRPVPPLNQLHHRTRAIRVRVAAASE